MSIIDFFNLDFTTAFTMLVSLVALLFSVSSYNVAKEAKNVAVKTYTDERSLVLHCQPTKNDLRINLKPIDDNHKLITGRAYFSDCIIDKYIEIDSKGCICATGIIENKIKEILRKDIIIGKDQAVINDMNLPLYIQSIYVCKGKQFNEISLYIMTISSVIISERQSLSVKSIMFCERLPEGTEAPINKLNDIMKDKNSAFIIPSNHPK